MCPSARLPVREEPAPTLPSTRFEIGSVTKTFTALLFAQLAAGGEVDPHTPVARLVPEAHGGLRGVTLQHLATHTSGLPRIPPGLFRAGRAPLVQQPLRVLR